MTPTGGDATDIPRDLRFGRFHYALLALLGSMIALVVATGFYANKVTAIQSGALSDYVRQQWGSVSALQRDSLNHLVIVERWNQGAATDRELEISTGVLYRQFSVLSDEADEEPAFAEELASLRADIATVNALLVDGPVTPSSPERERLDQATRELMAHLEEIGSLSESRRAQYLRWLEDSMFRARLLEWISGGSTLVLGTFLIISLQRMFQVNYRSARNRLEAEQARREEARAQTVRIENQFREVVEAVSDVVFRADDHGRWTLLSKAWQRLTGNPVEAAIGRSMVEFVHPDDRRRVDVMLDRLLSGTSGQAVEEVSFGPPCYGRTVVLSVRSSTDDDGRYLAGTVVDVTDRTRAQQLAAAQSEILELVARGTDVGEVLDRIIERISPFTPGVRFRFRPPEDPDDVVVEGEGNRSIPLTGSMVVPGGGAGDEGEHGEPLGHLDWEVSAHADPDLDVEPIASLVARLGALALDRQQSVDRIAYQASHDSLTGLPNRELLARRIEESIAAKAGTDGELAIMFLDVDRFKVVNDSLGHHAGDRLLVALANRISGALRPTDTVARFGGDEFVVLINRAPSRSQVESIAGRILEIVAEPVDVGVETINASTSIGIVFGKADSTVDDLLKYADMAMYKAKQAGRADFVVFDEDMKRVAAERQVTEVALRRAIVNGEFEAWYQPSIDLESGRLKGFEALVRWNRPGQGIVPPDEFIPLAEELGLIGEIDRWMLAQAGAQLDHWSAVDPTLTVSVNVSGVELSDPEAVEVMAEILSGITSASRIVLEVTETALLNDTRDIEPRLAWLRTLGPRVAIDDFGTGYSSLQHLRELSVDVIKIDRSFVSSRSDADDGEDVDVIKSPTIVASVTELGHALGLEVVAEGVETATQADSLRLMGVDSAQGYLFGKPTPPSDLVAMIAMVGQSLV